MQKWIMLALTGALLAPVGCKDNQVVTPEEVPPIDVKEVDDAVPPAAAKEAPAPEGGETKEAEGGGQWVVSNTYGAKFRVPEDWKVTIEPDGVSATDSDDTTTAVLVGAKSDGMIQAAVSDIQKKVKIKDAKFDQTSQVVINGFPGQTVRGTAVLEKGDLDQEIQFIAYNLKMGKGAVTMMIFSEAEMYEAKKETIEGLAQTLTKG